MLGNGRQFSKEQNISSFPGQESEIIVINKRGTSARCAQPEEQFMAVSVDLGGVLDKAYEGKSLKGILAAPRPPPCSTTL